MFQIETGPVKKQSFQDRFYGLQGLQTGRWFYRSTPKVSSIQLRLFVVRIFIESVFPDSENSAMIERLLRISFMTLLMIASTGMSAQYSISGYVLDGQSGNPLEGASVFINNATKGTSTFAEGRFILGNIKEGQYQLVISMIGYDPAVREITVERNIDTIRVRLQTRAVSLKPVIILPEKQRLYYLGIFRNGFIGRSANAASCRILNPDILSFDYNDRNSSLEVSADDFLIVENKILGYRIKFLLNKFVHSVNADGSYTTYYDGQALFEEMEGGSAKKRQWIKNRLKTYFGSSMHFFRAALDQRLIEDGFVLHTLIRKQNEQRPPDEVIDAKINRFRKPAAAMTSRDKDSLEYWAQKARQPKTIQYLLRDTVRSQQIIHPTDQKGIYALGFQNYLYVVYTKGKSELRSAYYDKTNNSAIPYSIFELKNEYAFFDESGVLMNPQSLVFEGYFGENGGLANMLPTDYEPEKR
jgi:hypothetical protein